MNLRMSRREILIGAAALACGRGAAAGDTGAVVGAAGLKEQAGAGATNGAGASESAASRSPNRAGSAMRASGAAGASSAAERIVALEKREGGRLGVFALDTATGRRLEHRGGERFAMCSTFKFLAAAAILQRVDRGADSLDRQIEYSEADLLEYASVSKEHVKEGRMVLAD